MKIKQSYINKCIIRYTVITTLFGQGTITVVEGSEVKVGDFVRGIKVKDAICDSIVKRILKTEIYNCQLVECLIDPTEELDLVKELINQ